MNKKYKLTDETIQFNGKTLHRIECVTPFGYIEKGEKGGFVESESNLSKNGDAWVYGNAKVYGYADVYGNAKVFGDALVSGDAKVFGNAWVYDNAKVSGHAEVFGNAKVSGHAEVFGNAKVYDNATIRGNAIVNKQDDYIVFKNNWSSGRYFTYTKSNDMWSVGCFYGTGEELIKKAYSDSEVSGKKYEAYVKFVENFNKIDSVC